VDIHTFTKQDKKARKLMASVFWARKGLLVVEFVQQGTTLISEVFCEDSNVLSFKTKVVEY
jgi:hypothetical protein